MSADDADWRVDRWNGRSKASLKTVYSGDEPSARAYYEQNRKRLLHGFVQLVSPHGITLASASAPGISYRTQGQTMHDNDRCPSTGALCRSAVCERGGCRKMRTGSPKGKIQRIAAPAARRAANPAPEQVEIDALRHQLASSAAERDRLASALNDAIEALAHVDASLTHLQESLGVRSSPKLDAVRTAEAKLRAAVRDSKLFDAAPVPAA